MELNALLTLFSLFFGLVLGSFLNVCIFRIPEHRSIITPPSSCPNCDQRIRFYDNIPVLSYIFLMGKCRNCRHPIPLRYPVVESCTGLLSLALFMRYGLTPQYALFLLFTAALVTVTFIDLQHQIIPDVITIPGILLGFVVSFFPFTGTSWLESLIGILGGGGFFYLFGKLFKILRGKEGLGGGDVTLLAMIGAWMGWQDLPFIILISALSGTLMGGGALLLSKRNLSEKIPYGPFIVFGALACLFFGADIRLWYYGHLGLR